jgi:hypothetical protein
MLFEVLLVRPSRRTFEACFATLEDVRSLRGLAMCVSFGQGGVTRAVHRVAMARLRE